MANKRYLLKALTRQATTFLFRNTHPSLPSLSFSSHFPNPQTSLPFFTKPLSAFAQCSNSRFFSSHKTSDHSKKIEDRSDQEEEEEEEEDEDDFEDEEDYESGEEEEGYDDENSIVSSRKKVYTEEEKEAEALDIGYKVVGPLHKDDRVFKPYEPVFAVVQIGSHQFKVSNRDSIFTERLKFCEVNDKLILNKVLLVGSNSQTIVGRPTVPGAAVHAVVEEHALDAKVIIFKKKRRKNYRRTKGHRQELTKLRITNIEGIEKPQNVVVEKPSKAAKREQEKVAVTA